MSLFSDTDLQEFWPRLVLRQGDEVRVLTAVLRVRSCGQRFPRRPPSPAGRYLPGTNEWHSKHFHMTLRRCWCSCLNHSSKPRKYRMCWNAGSLAWGIFLISCWIPYWLLVLCAVHCNPAFPNWEKRLLVTPAWFWFDKQRLPLKLKYFLSNNFFLIAQLSVLLCLVCR